MVDCRKCNRGIRLVMLDDALTMRPSKLIENVCIFCGMSNEMIPAHMIKNGRCRGYEPYLDDNETKE